MGEHGKIVINVSRGKRVDVELWRLEPDSWTDDVPDTIASSKAVVKDNHVSHAVG